MKNLLLSVTTLLLASALHAQAPRKTEVKDTHGRHAPLDSSYLKSKKPAGNTTPAKQVAKKPATGRPKTEDPDQGGEVFKKPTVKKN